MVKTGARAAELAKVLASAGRRFRATKPAAPRIQDLPPRYRDAIFELYRRLGGALEEPQFRPGAWDLVLEDGLMVELDEQFHFTRYRALTLEASFGRDLPWAQAYREFAEMHESKAIAPGGRWANPSTERMFGGSDPVGEFHALGSSRWKQRALYDAIKDAAAACGIVRLSRVSTYDVIAGESLDRVLYGRAQIDPEAIASLVDRRATS